MTGNLIRIGESELWWDGDGKLKQSGLDHNSKSVFTDDDDSDDGDGDGDGNDGDGDDIYIMMQCLCVTKNEHSLLGVSCNHLLPSITPLYSSRLVFMVPCQLL